MRFANRRAPVTADIAQQAFVKLSQVATCPRTVRNSDDADRQRPKRRAYCLPMQISPAPDTIPDRRIHRIRIPGFGLTGDLVFHGVKLGKQPVGPHPILAHSATVLPRRTGTGIAIFRSSHGHQINRQEDPVMPSGKSIKNEDLYESLRDDGMSKEKAARIANAKAQDG